VKVMFVHDHRIINFDDKKYSNGSFSDDVLNRYTNVFGHITFYSRNILLDRMVKKMSLIKNENVSFLGVNSFSSLLYYEKRYEINYQIENADAIIVRLPSVLGLLAVRKAKQKFKPYLIELVGCPWDALWNHSWKGKLLAPFMWYATKKAVKNAPYVLYVTDEFLQNRCPSIGKTIGCSNVALPTLDESVLDARLHKIKQITKNKPIVIGTTAAVDVRYKGQEYVIQAIAELNKQGYNFEYHLVGGGDKIRLQSIAKKYGVADKVIFEGSMPHEKVFDYLDDIDIYVQPSKTEGLPRALIEAMSRSCPCIGSNAGGIPELLDNTCIFSNGDANELASILVSFDKEKMIYQAKRNFEMSKSYSKEVIETRRNKFFKDFAESVDNL
jgi:glycosyltransferase involved in cell wall biosynthesis